MHYSYFHKSSFDLVLGWRHENHMSWTTAKVHLSCIICMVYFHLSRLYYTWSMCIPYLVGIPFIHIRRVVFLPRSEAPLVPIVGSMLVIPILWIPWLFDEVPEGCLVVMVGGSGKGWGGWTFIFFGGGVWGCLGLVCLGEEVRVRLTLLVFF